MVAYSVAFIQLIIVACSWYTENMKEKVNFIESNNVEPLSLLRWLMEFFKDFMVLLRL